jgi:hypothetical protein
LRQFVKVSGLRWLEHNPIKLNRIMLYGCLNETVDAFDETIGDLAVEPAHSATLFAAGEDFASFGADCMPCLILSRNSLPPLKTGM